MFKLIEKNNNKILLESNNLDHVKRQYDNLIEFFKLFDVNCYEFAIEIIF